MLPIQNLKFEIRNSRRGFTLIEILLFSAIFSIVMGAFITVFVTVTRIQGRQTSVAEVNQQSQFLLQTLQRYIETSSLIETPITDQTSSTLRLRMAAPASDPTLIYLSGNVVYIQEGSSAATPLTSGRVLVTAFNFTKHANPPGHDQVSITFTMQYNVSNALERFAQSLQTSVARVSAATFDSSVVPSSTATYKLGVTGQTWISINDVINFNGTNVGIGVASPGQKLEIAGGVLLNQTGAASSSCAAAQRGTLWYGQQGANTTDTLIMCVKDGGGAYQWVRVY